MVGTPHGGGLLPCGPPGATPGAKRGAGKALALYRSLLDTELEGRIRRTSRIVFLTDRVQELLALTGRWEEERRVLERSLQACMSGYPGRCLGALAAAFGGVGRIARYFSADRVFRRSISSRQAAAEIKSRFLAAFSISRRAESMRFFSSAPERNFSSAAWALMPFSFDRRTSSAAPWGLSEALASRELRLIAFWMGRGVMP